MRVRWTEPAFIQWQESFEYIETENPDAANRLARKIVDAVEMLLTHPYAGHIGKVPGTREFAVPNSAFVIIYDVRLREDTLGILAVYDGRRRWPKSLPRE